VRLNSVNTNHFHDDIAQAVGYLNIVRVTYTKAKTQMKIPSIRIFILPKIDTVTQLDHVSRQIFTAYQSNARAIDESHAPLQLVASVESAKSLWNLNGIGQWKSEYGDTLGGKLGALLVRGAQISSTAQPNTRPSLRQKIVCV
jgi:hypothetical protein